MFNPNRIISWAWMAVFVIWVAASITAKRPVRKQSPGSRLLQTCLGLCAGLLIWGGIREAVLGWCLVPRTPTSANAAVVLTLSGIVFALWARFALGRNWSGTVTLKQDHELVRSGPYRIVRHPIYSGFLLALLGTVIAYGNLGAFLGLAITGLALHLKSRTEESFMTEQFGSRYTAYKREVRALIPYVCGTRFRPGAAAADSSLRGSIRIWSPMSERAECGAPSTLAIICF